MTWFSVGAAVVGAAGSMMAADSSASATKGAAKTSADASRYATDVQKEVFDQQRSDQAPWRVTGGAAVNRLAELMGLSVPDATALANAETRDQVRARLEPQFTTTSGVTSDVKGLMRDYYAKLQDPRIASEDHSQLDNYDANRWLDLQSTSVVDENALTAAINAEMAKQSSVDPNRPKSADFGSLTKNFGMADFQADPGYSFRMAEGLKALDRSAAARGGLLSGASLKGISRYGQDLASQEYGNAFNRYQTNQGNLFNRLSGLAGTGQTSVNQTGQAGQNYASNVGNIAMTNAANQGNAQLAAGNANSSMYSGIGNALGRVNWGSLGTGTGTTSQPFSSGWDAGYYDASGMPRG